MVELPSGTVTFLFTDIEGSTRLLKQLRDGYGAVLADQRRILRAAFAEHDGQEIDTQGDAFFAAFRRAKDAALAAASAQRALAAQSWPEDAECRVRMGLHTGEPNVGDEGYHGLGVHRGARIMAAGHGGQVLLSQATSSVLEDDVLDGIGLRDLGQFQLKDMDRPEHLFQLEIEGLPSDFPPLRTAVVPTAYTGQEAELEQAARAALWRTRFASRRWHAVALAGLAVVVAIIGSVFLFGGSDDAQALSQVDANAVGLIDATTGKIMEEVPVGSTPGDLAVGEGAVWVSNSEDGTVSRIDPATRTVVQAIDVGSSPSGITTGKGAVWVANSLGANVSRIDPGVNKAVQTIDVGNGPLGIVFAAGSIWVANTGDGTITRIAAGSGAVAQTLPIAATELAFGAGTIWATDTAGRNVVRIDPSTGKVVAMIPVGNGPSGIAFGAGAAWVANSLDGTVARIDPSTNAVAATVRTGDRPTSIAADTHGAWVVNRFDGTLVRIDSRNNLPGRPIAVGNRPQAVSVSDGDVLVSVRESGEEHRGGTLTVRMNRDVDYIDSAIAYDSTALPVLRMTGDGLVAFDQASGLAGTQLVPDLAVSIPTATDAGKTYAFHLRPNIQYSNGLPVRAADFRYAIERAFRLGQVPAILSFGVVGADRCIQSPKRCDLSQGIVTDDAAGTVTFHLAQRDPDFLSKLSFPFAFPVSAGTRPSAAGTDPLPATGPYMIESYRPGRKITLVRNPHFRQWSQAAQPDGYPDRIVFAVGGTPDRAVRDVVGGKADVFTTSQSQTPPTESLLAEIRARFASQVRTNPQPATVGLFLNTHLPPFDRVEVRQALNYAADRTAAVHAAGGPDVAQVTCQILPPYFPGYRPYCPYSTGASSAGTWTAPDLARARALVAASGTRGMKITVWSWKDFSDIGPFTVKLLRSLGYRATLRERGSDSYFQTIGDSRTGAQIGTVEWISDYPSAYGFFRPILTCGSFIPASPDNANASQFCDRRIDRQIDMARAEQDTNPDAARGLWERIDRQTADQAPWVPLVNPRAVDVLSKRVGDYQYSAPQGLLMDQLWVR